MAQNRKHIQGINRKKKADIKIDQDQDKDKEKEIIFFMKRGKTDEPIDILSLEDEKTIEQFYEQKKLRRLDLNWLAQQVDQKLNITNSSLNQEIPQRKFVLQRIDPTQQLICSKRDAFYQAQRKIKNEEFFRERRKEFLNSKLAFQINNTREQKLVCTDMPYQTLDEFAQQEYESEIDQLEFYCLKQQDNVIDNLAPSVKINKDALQKMEGNDFYEQDYMFQKDHQKKDDESHDSEDSNRSSNPENSYPSEDSDDDRWEENIHDTYYDNYPQSQYVDDDSENETELHKKNDQIFETEEEIKVTYEDTRKKFFAFLDQHLISKQMQKNQRDFQSFNYEKDF